MIGGERQNRGGKIEMQSRRGEGREEDVERVEKRQPSHNGGQRAPGTFWAPLTSKQGAETLWGSREAKPSEILVLGTKPQTNKSHFNNAPPCPPSWERTTVEDFRDSQELSLNSPGPSVKSDGALLKRQTLWSWGEDARGTCPPSGVIIPRDFLCETNVVVVRPPSKSVRVSPVSPVFLWRRTYGEESCRFTDV
ncbi:hypothetical protein EYF80_029762 [Liparis tanakae]|uniref:Uncharacterized protein n=1 Tax=Liparis tanakae TaxID=230148 RepID=A0A4Z2H597_9TELE|nr:hypothetical protein EYF80_029762 [Liparis tanakae]